MKNISKWEQLTVGSRNYTERLKVDGGYIYETDKGICFVPDVDLQRYQSHLRDAYNQGYKQGLQDSKLG